MHSPILLILSLISSTHSSSENISHSLHSSNGHSHAATRDFEHTHSTLHKLFPSFPLPPLPAKRRVGKKRDGEVEERRRALEVMVQQLVNVTLFQVDEWFDFLDMNNANRVFSVGTATQAQAKDEVVPGAAVEGSSRGEGVVAAAGSGGGVVRSRAALRNGSDVVEGGTGGGVGSSGRSGGRAARQQPAARSQQPVATTNPFD